jgi:hypothetical protein
MDAAATLTSAMAGSGEADMIHEPSAAMLPLPLPLPHPTDTDKKKSRGELDE